jgi:large subunit ribosomal protein L25
MKTVSLSAEHRSGIGKSVTRKLRVAGVIPANLYGSGGDPVTMQVKNADLIEIFRHHGSNVLIELNFEGEEAILSLIREHQIHPVSRKSVHLDFQRVQLGKPINVIIPIEVVGEAPGVRNFGGILEQITRSVEVSCLPREIPDSYVVDVSELDINESIHISDLEAGNVEFLVDDSQIIVNVSPPRLSTEVDETEEGEEGEGAEGEEGAEGSDEGDAENKDS